MNKAPKRLCQKCGKCCENVNCKYLRYDKACMIYADRPEECKNFPFDIWADTPSGCGYTGWIFLQREIEKQKVRLKKEKILSIKVKMKYATVAKKTLLNDEIQKIKKFIKTYEPYGAKDW